MFTIWRVARHLFHPNPIAQRLRYKLDTAEFIPFQYRSHVMISIALDRYHHASTITFFKKHFEMRNSKRDKNGLILIRDKVPIESGLRVQVRMGHIVFHCTTYQGILIRGLRSIVLLLTQLFINVKQINRAGFCMRVN